MCIKGSNLKQKTEEGDVVFEVFPSLKTDKTSDVIGIVDLVSSTSHL